MAIKKASGKYLTLALIDDRKSQDFIQTMFNAIEDQKDVGLVYGDCYCTDKKNDIFEKNGSKKLLENSLNEFTRNNMIKCLPGPMPMWKRNIHQKVGFLNEVDNDFADDWEMWLRMVDAGVTFRKVNKVVGLYLEGGRSQQGLNIKQRREEAKIFYKYSHLFGLENRKKYDAYFRQFL